MPSLFGVELPGMILKNRHGSLVARTATTWRAIDGTAHEQTMTRNGGLALDLVSGRDYGWVTHATLNTLKSYVEANSSGVLQEQSEVIAEVRFRFEDGPVLEFEPLFPVSVPTDTTPYYGTIKLITIAEA